MWFLYSLMYSGSGSGSISILQPVVTHTRVSVCVCEDSVSVLHRYNKYISYDHTVYPAVMFSVQMWSNRKCVLVPVHTKHIIYYIILYYIILYNMTVPSPVAVSTSVVLLFAV